jgi:adenine-specific DNA-methyltransferase
MNRANQLITYMGNKRKLVSVIEDELAVIQTTLGGGRLRIGEAFSGSGAVSRMLREHASHLSVNDNASYSVPISECYLTHHSVATVEALVEGANAFADAVESGETEAPPWIRLHWSCADLASVLASERLYYTPQNATRLDAYRHFIETHCPEEERPCLLAPLLYEASVHVNTSGHFAAFYRDGEGRGACGGSKAIDFRRITQPIRLSPPPAPPVGPHVEVRITRLDAEAWAEDCPECDVVYIDPPYNKHPYATYYFMLDVLAVWDTNAMQPDTLRGQQADWVRSKFNSTRHAASALEALVNTLKTKFIILSYNSKGILSEDQVREILERKGSVELRRLTHNTYNKLQGVASYKRVGAAVKPEEHLWVVDCR